MCGECVAYIDRAAPLLVSIASDLRTSPEPEVLSRLADFDQGLKWLTDFSLKGDLFLVDEETKVAFATFVVSLNNMSKEFVSALERKDFIDLADILEHEFVVALTKFRDIVRPLIPH